MNGFQDGFSRRVTVGRQYPDAPTPTPAPAPRPLSPWEQSVQRNQHEIAAARARREATEASQREADALRQAAEAAQRQREIARGAFAFRESLLDEVFAKCGLTQDEREKVYLILSDARADHDLERAWYESMKIVADRTEALRIKQVRERCESLTRQGYKPGWDYILRVVHSGQFTEGEITDGRAHTAVFNKLFGEIEEIV